MSKIERFHRISKEISRCCFGMLPFDYLPRMMVAHLMITIIFYSIDFACLKGVS